MSSRRAEAIQAVGGGFHVIQRQVIQAFGVAQHLGHGQSHGFDFSFAQAEARSLAQRSTSSRVTSMGSLTLRSLSLT